MTRWPSFSISVRPDSVKWQTLLGGMEHELQRGENEDIVTNFALPEQSVERLRFPQNWSNSSTLFMWIEAECWCEIRKKLYIVLYILSMTFSNGWWWKEKPRDIGSQLSEELTAFCELIRQTRRMLSHWCHISYPDVQRDHWCHIDRSFTTCKLQALQLVNYKCDSWKEDKSSCIEFF
jgi:hypothetical protein